MEQDDVEVLWWYRKSAKQRYAQAQFRVGLVYDEGRGVKQDAVAAVTWYRKSAEQQYALAQTNLGFMYAYGKGMGKDAVQALALLHLAGDDFAKLELCALVGGIS